MALNSAINTGSLGTGFVYSNGLGGLTANAGVLITKYTASNTWTMNSKTQSVTIIAWNAGGGGGSGRQGSTTAAGGGSGGSGGGYLVYSGLATFFNSSETVTIAGTAAGGLTQGSVANGNTGTNGGITSIGNIYSTNTLTGTGNRGLGGVATSTGPIGAIANFNIGGAYPAGFATGYNAGAGTNTTGTTPTSIAWGSAGITNGIYINAPGGGGGGADAVVIRSGGVGGAISSISPAATDLITLSAGGTAGIESGTINGGLGNNQISTTGGRYIGATGGGGGGGQSAGVVAGTGGNGGLNGAGGGGGGGSLTGTTSGAGGDGGRGELWVIELF